MPWDDTARKQHSRDGLRYPSDLTDREWCLIEPLLPPAKRGGRPRTTDLRAVTEAVLYIASSGCQWRMLPKDFPPVSTVRGYFYAWRDAGLWQTINHLLVMSTRELEGREASPTAGVINSQSVKTTESGGVCGLRRGQEGQGTQAPHHHRYARPDAVHGDPRCRLPGPRWRTGGAEGDPTPLSLAALRIPRHPTAYSSNIRPAAPRASDRSAVAPEARPSSLIPTVSVKGGAVAEGCPREGPARPAPCPPRG